MSVNHYKFILKGQRYSTVLPFEFPLQKQLSRIRFHSTRTTANLSKGIKYLPKEADNKINRNNEIIYASPRLRPQKP